MLIYMSHFTPPYIHSNCHNNQHILTLLFHKPSMNSSIPQELANCHNGTVTFHYFASFKSHFTFTYTKYTSPNNFLHNIHLINHLIHHLQAQINCLQGVSMAAKSAHSHSTSKLKNFSINQTPITPLQTLTKQQSKTQTYLWMRLLKSSLNFFLFVPYNLPKRCGPSLMKRIYGFMLKMGEN